MLFRTDRTITTEELPDFSELIESAYLKISLDLRKYDGSKDCKCDEIRHLFHMQIEQILIRAKRCRESQFLFGREGKRRSSLDLKASRYDEPLFTSIVLTVFDAITKSCQGDMFLI